MHNLLLYMNFKLPTLVSSVLVTLPLLSHEEVLDLPELEVEGREAQLVGEAISASQGFIAQQDLENRPILRVGELLEAIPGMIATQHSGAGKANQYFLRGFNLDHGTDFATFVDGMPVNMVSHGHGQGYTDINFVIPELTGTIAYKKGPYYSDVGDFSSAGSAEFKTVNSLDKDKVELSIGEDQHYRALIAGSQALGKGTFLFGLENETDNGPWDKDENLDKQNGLLKYSLANDHSSLSVSLMGYGASWDSTDQIPERAVAQNIISPLGSLDDTTGGRSSRYSLSANWRHFKKDTTTDISVYSIYYDLNLWSNFTYFLDDPINGDQFEQVDERMIYGFSASQSWHEKELFGAPAQHTLGVQLRFDDIDEVGLYHTQDRRRLDTTREDSIQEQALSAYYESQIRWSTKFKTTFGLRADHFDFKVNSNIEANSGNADDFLLSPKLNATYTVNEQLEYYFSGGFAFHSNDARGTTISVDPSNGVDPIDPVDPLVRSKGAEIGARYFWNEKSNTSIALWSLDLDSELLFVGDAGNTEATRPSGRYGVEIANYIATNEWLSFDFDLAFTQASFSDDDPSGDDIPGSIDTVASAGINISDLDGWFGSLRLRHFGGSPLIEDGSVTSDSFLSFNLRVGFQAENWRVSLDALNLLDSKDYDITYLYASRLKGEPLVGVEERHFHIIPPRSFRLNVSYEF